VNSSGSTPSGAAGQHITLQNVMVRSSCTLGACRYPGTSILCDGTRRKLLCEMEEGLISVSVCGSASVRSSTSCSPSETTCASAGRPPCTAFHTASVSTICPGWTSALKTSASCSPPPLYSARTLELVKRGPLTASLGSLDVPNKLLVLVPTDPSLAPST
jgi:hypothetical protein